MATTQVDRIIRPVPIVVPERQRLRPVRDAFLAAYELRSVYSRTRLAKAVEAVYDIEVLSNARLDGSLLAVSSTDIPREKGYYDALRGKEGISFRFIQTEFSFRLEEAYCNKKWHDVIYFAQEAIDASNESPNRPVALYTGWLNDCRAPGYPRIEGFPNMPAKVALVFLDVAPDITDVKELERK